MRFGVVRLPGRTCDDDAVRATQDALASLGVTGRVIGLDETDLAGVEAVIVTGSLAEPAPILAAVEQFAADGGPVLGVCGGFRVLCERGLLDGALAPDESPELASRDVHCIVEGRPTPFTHAIPAGRHIRLSIAHSEGRYSHPDIESVEAEGRVVLRYCAADGEVTRDANPNGSVNNIAGVCSAAGNVVGLMPHPERARDGHALFQSAVAWHTGTPARV